MLYSVNYTLCCTLDHQMGNVYTRLRHAWVELSDNRKNDVLLFTAVASWSLILCTLWPDMAKEMGHLLAP